MTRKKSKAADPAKDTSARLQAFLRRLRKPRIAKVAAELAAFVHTAGPSLAPTAQALGVLQKAAALGEHELVIALLDAGVDPNADSEERPGDDRALAAVFDEWEIDDDKAVQLVRVLLARGANPDHLNHDSPLVVSHNMRRTTALDAAVRRRAMGSVAELAKASSATTRTHALCTFLEDTSHTGSDAILERLIEIADLDLPDHDGLYPLHCAAKRGDLPLFERLYAKASTKLPRLGRDVHVPQHLAVPPGGGSYPSLCYPAGASPLAVARLVRARLVQTLGEYERISTGGRSLQQQRLDATVSGCAAIIAFLEQQGHVDDTRPVALAPPLATVLAACTELAASLGVTSFPGHAALIDPGTMGAFGYFLACAKLIRTELDEARRARLEQHLVGRFITGSVERRMLHRDETDELAEVFGPDPDTYCVWPENFPEEFRALLDSTVHYGVDGDAVLTLEARDNDTTKLWEVSPTAGIDHGPVDLWVRAAVAALLQA